VLGDSATETHEGQSSVSADIGEAFRWNVRLSDKDPSKRWGVLAIAVIAFALGLLLFKNVLFGAVGFAIILGTTAEYWLGVSYKLDSKGASARCVVSLTSLDWTDVKRAIATDEGIKLSPLDSAGRMDTFRGVFLRYGTQRDRVTETVRRWLPTHVDLMGG
jgi:hypothetical protein